MFFRVVLYLSITIVCSIPAKCQIIGFFNQPPTIDAIDEPVVVLENSGNQSIILTGISYGNDRYYQQLTITAESSKPQLIPHPVVQYGQGSIANLSFTPQKDQNGITTITVRLDDGHWYNNITEMSFQIIVTPVNGRPTFQLLSGPPAIEEGAGEIKIKKFAFNMNDGDPEVNQKLQFITTIKGATDQMFFKKEPEIDNKDGELKYELRRNSYGEAIISVYLKDDGGTENGGHDTSLESTFTIVVIGQNDKPTLDAISDPDPIAEDAPIQQLGLTGITAGKFENDPLTISASSSNPDLISEITVDYTNPSTAGTISYKPNADRFGTCTITVTVDDGQSQDNIVTRSFTVEVRPVADTPSITDAKIKGGGQTTTGLVISRNPADGEEVTHFKITGISNGTLYLNNGTTSISNGSFITYAQGNKGLKFTPSFENSSPGSFYVQAATGKGDQFLGGSKTLAQIFIENDEPTLDAINNPGPIQEDALVQKISLSGITAGKLENQPLTIRATSSNLALISEITVDYKSPSTTGSISYKPNANKFGTSIITVTVDDGQSQNNTIARSFTVEVKPLADTPSITNAVVHGVGQTTSGLVIGRNPADGEEVSHFKITSILNGALYLNNGTTQLSNGSFITFSQGRKGLRFTHSYGHKEPGSFEIQAATGKGDQYLGGSKAQAVITIDNKPPKITSAPVTNAEIPKTYTYNILASDPDSKDQLTYTFVIPKQIRSWLKAKDNKDKTAILRGAPPTGSHGTYNLYIKVEDLFGQYDEQRFALQVIKQNNKPELMLISENLDEDEQLDFSLSTFEKHYSDRDGDKLDAVKIVNIPQRGRLFLKDVELKAQSVIESGELDEFKYIPDQDYFGQDVFDWSASDGKEYSQSSQQVKISIAPVNDAPSLNPINNQKPVSEDASIQQVSLSGVSPGKLENQPLTIRARSSNLELISEITIDYKSPSTAGSVSYKPNANRFGTSIITITVDDGESINNTIAQSFSVEVNPIADLPSVTDAIVRGVGQTTSGLVISRNPADGEEVTHFKISSIINGNLYLNNGTTQLSNGSFINYTQGQKGLRFTHSYGHEEPGSFEIQAATGSGNQYLGGAKVQALITVENDPPEINSQPVTVVEIPDLYSYMIFASDSDPNDQLTYTFMIPERIQSWLKATDNNDKTALLQGTPPTGGHMVYMTCTSKLRILSDGTLSRASVWR